MEYLSEIVSFIVGAVGGSTLTFFRMSKRSATASGDGAAVIMGDASAGQDNVIGSSIGKKN